MPILNMVWWWKKWGNIGEPLNLTVTSIWLDAIITWEDNEIWTIPPTTFQKSELVRKIGSAPTSPSDWDLVVTETVKDTYKTTWYVDQWLTDWETYYYRVFSYSDLGGISYCDAVSVTISGSWQPWANTLVWWRFNDNLDDSSGNNVTLSWTPYWYITWVSGDALHNKDNTLTSSLSQSSIFSWAFTVAFFVCLQWSNDLQRLFWESSRTRWIDVQFEFYNDFTWFQVYNNSNAKRISFPFTKPTIWEWHSFVVTWDGVNQIECYIDWVQTSAYPNYNQTFDYPSVNYNLMVRGNDWGDSWLDEVVIENKYWTQTDVDAYLANYS